jgi:predicted LPLAT superfamily acyltransferase
MSTKSWLSVAERGSVLGMRILVLLCTGFGRGPAQLVLRLVAAYYVAFHGKARRASRAYLVRMGQPHDLGAIYRHILRFAQCALDRLFFLRRDFAPFTVDTVGSEHLVALRDAKQGAILLGAHLGSFEAMRASGDGLQLPLNVVGHFGNARAINRLLDDHSGRVRTRLIEIKPQSVEFIFQAKELVERGEMLAILGDRVMGGPFTEVTFLGGKVRLPTGPFVLAATLKCPIYLTFGLFFPPNRYQLHCEPLMDRVVLPRQTRAEALKVCVQQYASRLEHYCRLAPDNWFNFFDFWSESDA